MLFDHYVSDFQSRSTAYRRTAYLSSLGLVAFFFISAIFTFNNSFFQSLFGKSQSHAFVGVIGCNAPSIKTAKEEVAPYVTGKMVGKPDNAVRLTAEAGKDALQQNTDIASLRDKLVANPGAAAVSSWKQSLQSMAQDRRSELADVMRQDPNAAWAIIANDQRRGAQLDVMNNSCRPVQTTLSGTFQVTHFDSGDGYFSTTHYYLTTADNQKYEVFPAYDFQDRFAFDHSGLSMNVTGYLLGHDIVVNAQDPNTVTGAHIDGNKRLSWWQQLIDKVMPQTVNATHDGHALGTQKVAVLLADNGNGLSVSASDVNSRMSDVASFYNEDSFGKTTIQSTTYGPMSVSASCDSDGPTIDNSVLNTFDSSVDFSQYSRVLIALSCPTAWGEWDGQFSRDNANFDVSIVTDKFWGTTYGPGHELGHALGPHHAEFSAISNGNCTGGTTTYASDPGYNDCYDIMGANSGRHSNAYHLRLTGWVDDTQTQTISASGAWTLTPEETSSGLKVIRVPDGNGSYVYIEYRQPTGYDANLGNTGGGSTNVFSGVLLHRPVWVNLSGGYADTDLIDATGKGDPKQAALVPGNSYTIGATGSKIMVSNATSSGICVTVYYNGASTSATCGSGGTGGTPSPTPTPTPAPIPSGTTTVEAYPDHTQLASSSGTYNWKSSSFQVTSSTDLSLKAVGFYQAGAGDSFQVLQSDANGTMSTQIASGTLAQAKDNNGYFGQNLSSAVTLKAGQYYIFRVNVDNGSYYYGSAYRSDTDLQFRDGTMGSTAPAPGNAGAYEFRLSYTKSSTVSGDDLSVPSFTLTDSNGNTKTSFTPGEAVYVKLTAKNGGSSSAASGAVTMIYRDSSSAPAANTASDISGSMQITHGSFAANSSYVYCSTSTCSGGYTGQFKNSSGTVVSSFAAPSTAGSYTAWAYINYNNSITEASTTNNTASINYSVASSSSPTPTPKPSTSPTPTPTPTPTPAASQLLKNPGFESGNNGNWSDPNGTITSSSQTTYIKPHAGSYFAWLGGYSSAQTDAISQQVAIPSNITKATLSFYLWIGTSETDNTKVYDTMKVQVKNSSGTVTTLQTYSNMNYGSSYVQKTADLSSYKGQTVTIIFTSTSDTSLQTSFAIDDTALNVQ